MLRTAMKNVLKTGLLAAVLAAPMAASAQSPFTAIIQFTQEITPGNPLVPIAPPAANGTYGFCCYIARNDNGANIDEYISGANIRMYYNSAQATLAAPGGVNANIQLAANGVARASTLPPNLAAPTADATNGDAQASTDFYRLASANFVSGNADAPLIGPGVIELPAGWTYAAPNNVPGTFVPVITLNITLTGGPFPPNVGVTPNPPNGTLATRRVDTNANGTDTVQTNFQNASIVPLAVDLTSLSASVAGDTATISWSTAAEYDNAGFVVYRDAAGDLGEAISTLVAAEGSAASGASYSVVDPAALAPGETRSYFLADIDLSGATTVHGPVSVTRGAASSVSGWELY